ncbi:hypothetical protein CEXT_133841 [Caerostris extrusa]|uniref:Uncharacterized protein n=1 Tax=Caerostris extrusa TaxID=172846 RepID=A0AAV4V602_CAEEX|nr:hypothetical protein CEXT_133841 [Caerostris extrusa]
MTSPSTHEGRVPPITSYDVPLLITVKRHLFFIDAKLDLRAFYLEASPRFLTGDDDARENKSFCKESFHKKGEVERCIESYIFQDAVKTAAAHACCSLDMRFLLQTFILLPPLNLIDGFRDSKWQPYREISRQTKTKSVARVKKRIPFTISAVKYASLLTILIYFGFLWMGQLKKR